MTAYVFWAAALALMYTYAGYPLLIWLLSRRFPRSVARAPFQPNVAIVIVAHNEADRIARKLESCLALDYPPDRRRVLVVSDGSTDATNEIVAGYATRGVTLLAKAERRGKAACLNDAAAACDDEVLIFTDARQRLDAAALRELTANLADTRVGAVSGELVFETDDMTGFGAGVDAYWTYEKFIRRHEARFHSVVGVTGALYALRRECFRPIPADTILDDVAIPMQVVMQGRRVVFEAGARAYDLPARDFVQEKRRKVRTLAGNFQLVAAYPALLDPLRNPLFMQFVSHKLLRLIAPVWLALLLLANLRLARYELFYQVVLTLHLAVYAMPLLSAALPRLAHLKPVRLANAFLSLNWFAVLGFVEFVRNREAHLWQSKSDATGA